MTVWVLTKYALGRPYRTLKPRRGPSPPHTGETAWDHGVLFRILIKEGRPLSLWALWILALGQTLTIMEEGPTHQGLMGPWGPTRPIFRGGHGCLGPGLHAWGSSCHLTNASCSLPVVQPGLLATRRDPELDLELASAEERQGCPASRWPLLPPPPVQGSEPPSKEAAQVGVCKKDTEAGEAPHFQACRLQQNPSEESGMSLTLALLHRDNLGL